MIENKERNAQILRLKRQGKGYRKIAKMFKVSPQRVHQIVKANHEGK